MFKYFYTSAQWQGYPEQFLGNLLRKCGGKGWILCCDCYFLTIINNYLFLLFKCLTMKVFNFMIFCESLMVFPNVFNFFFIVLSLSLSSKIKIFHTLWSSFDELNYFECFHQNWILLIIHGKESVTFQWQHLNSHNDIFIIDVEVWN